MVLVSDKTETFDDQQKAHEKAQEVLRAFPKVKGLQGSAFTDVAGIGLAIKERGTAAKTCGFGTSLPSIAGQYLGTGAVDGIGFRDPSVAPERGKITLDGRNVPLGNPLAAAEAGIGYGPEVRLTEGLFLTQSILHNISIGRLAAQGSSGMRAADQSAGVLRLYGDYSGDIMKFDMAGELVAFDDIRCTTVILADDVASAPPVEAAKRRGVAGMVHAFKIAGAAADAGQNLDEVTGIAQKPADACRSVGAALSPCTVPQAGKPPFHLGEDALEMGRGIDGEPGVWRGKRRPADAIADAMMDRLRPTCRWQTATACRSWSTALAPPCRRSGTSCPASSRRRLDAAGAAIVLPLVGRYATSMEMTGVSFTLCKLDAELEGSLTAPCERAFRSVQ